MISVGGMSADQNAVTAVLCNKMMKPSDVGSLIRGLLLIRGLRALCMILLHSPLLPAVLKVFSKLSPVHVVVFFNQFSLVIVV